ncbi:MAG: TRAP transporter substrate-binding protein DctP, partial [Clostridia bacterium]|nr:TRAP transporter substrate-binding protein DctP [Clostridia bacterium]
ILTDPAMLKKLPDTKLFKEWQAELEKQGIVYITNMYNGFRSFYTTTPVEHVSDLSGLRIRGFGNAIGNNLAKYLGFANIGIAWGAVFPGIQQKTLDGCEVQVATADGSRIYEVVKNLAMTKHYMLQSAFVCSSTFYNSMSAEDRELFTKTMRDAAAEYGAIIEKEEAGYYENMKKNGVKIVDVDINEFKQAIEPLYTNNDLGFSAGLKDRLFKELGN